MKYLKKYKIFESESYNKINNIFQTLHDICLELSDRNIKYVISPSDDINKKILGLQLFTKNSDDEIEKISLSKHTTKNLFKTFKVPFFIMINTRPIFASNWTEEDIKWFIDFLYQLESYMNDMGFKTSISTRSVKSISMTTDWHLHQSVNDFYDTILTLRSDEDKILDLMFRDIKIDFSKI